VSRLGRCLVAAWAIALQGTPGCSMKETLQTTLIASVPNSGAISTSFMVPNSRHVFVLIASPDSNAAFEGEVILVANGKTLSFPIGTSAVRSNWLQHRGLHSIMVNAESLTLEGSKARIDAGSKCVISVTISNTPPTAEIWLAYLTRPL
jgi:hypothetical protein